MTLRRGVCGEDGGTGSGSRGGARGRAESLGLRVGFGCRCGGYGRSNEVVSSGARRAVVEGFLSTGAGWDGYEGILGAMGRMLLRTWVSGRSQNGDRRLMLHAWDTVLGAVRGIGSPRIERRRRMKR